MINVDELKPHEEVMQSVVELLANEVHSERRIRDPLMVDRKDHVILDGMHRFSSLRLLNCRFVPCCLIDYDSPQIRVGSWFRLFNVERLETLAEQLLSEAQLKYSRNFIDIGSGKLNPLTILATHSAEYSLREQLDPIQRARIAVSLEKAMLCKGHDVTYASEIVAIEELRSGTANFIVPVPIFTKQQVRECGLTGHLLPHKVTRHVIPSRPLAINVPFSLLTDETISQAHADEKLGELLSTRRVERKPPGSIVDGRRYQEELLVFSE